MNKLYVVVYGPEWNDIMYFTSLEKAKIKLVKQSVGNSCDNYKPTLYEYSENDGVYLLSKAHWQVCLEMLELLELPETEIRINPNLAFPSIVTIV